MIVLASHERADGLDAVLVEPVGCQLRRRRFEGDPGFEDLVDVGVDEEQVHRHGVDDHVDRRRGDDEAAAGAAAHPRDVLELDQADRLAEHGPAGAVPLEQLGLRPQDDPLGPAGGGDVRDDPVGHRGGQLAAVALPLAVRSVGDVGTTHRRG